MPIRKIPERIIEVPYSHYANNMITEIDQWVIGSDTPHSGGGAYLVLGSTSNWGRLSVDGFDQKGIGITESNGVFSLPKTGYYKIQVHTMILVSGAANSYFGPLISTSTNGGSSWINRSYTLTGTGTTGAYVSPSTSYIFEVSDITNYKFRIEVQAAGACNINASGSQMRTGFTCTRLGEI